MTSFKHTRHGVVVSFDEVEASLLRHLVAEVFELLESPDEAESDPIPAPAAGAVPDAAMLAEMTGLGGPTPAAPADPVLRRLLPDGYQDDPTAAGDFRRYTEATLRADKRQNAQALLADLPGDGGGQVRLDADTVERWLTGLNDVRLSLGTRIGVTEEMAEPDPADPDAPSYAVYLWLTELQDVLVQVAADR
jgi:Domain of unknown function (DUF2017)